MKCKVEAYFTIVVDAANGQAAEDKVLGIEIKNPTTGQVVRIGSAFAWELTDLDPEWDEADS